MEMESFEPETNRKLGKKVESNFQCEKCYKYFSAKRSLSKHIRVFHLGVKNFLCQICEISFGQNHELKSHVMKKHSKDGEAPEKFHCDQCSKQFAEKCILNHHIKYMHEITEKNYHCGLW